MVPQERKLVQDIELIYKAYNAIHEWHNNEYEDALYQIREANIVNWLEERMDEINEEIELEEKRKNQNG